MNVLVTGGCGYQGSILIPKLLNKGFLVNAVDIMWFGNYLQPHTNLTVFQGDIREPKNSWFENVDVIIHLAAVANDPSADLSPKLTWEIGPLATMRLAEKAIQYSIKQFIYASSASVYGISEALQVTEEIDLNPISDYNKSKMITERVLLSYQDKFLLQMIRPATVCGYSSRMRLDLSVNMLTMQALTNQLITVFGGTQTRPNIHIDDLTDLYLFFIDHPNNTGIFNAGFENLSILEIAQTIKNNVDCDINISPTNDLRSYRVNSDKLLSLGFKARKNIQHAIEEIIEKYQKNILMDDNAFYNLKVMKNILTSQINTQ